MDRLGGLIHAMPWTAGLVLVGAAAAAALPLRWGGAHSEQQKRASCERSCVNDQCRITVNYGTIYVLDEFW